jgi:hypothetical protein
MHRFSALLFLAILAAAGCNDSNKTPPASAENTKVKAELDKLPAEDRALAEAQRVCPISREELGSMGPPIKLMVNDQPVFVCCKNCEGRALKSPDETLKRLEEVKASKAK